MVEMLEKIRFHSKIIKALEAKLEEIYLESSEADARPLKRGGGGRKVGFKGPVTKKIIETVKSSGQTGMTNAEVIKATKINQEQVNTTLHRLAKEGTLEKVARGRYAWTK